MNPKRARGGTAAGSPGEEKGRVMQERWKLLACIAAAAMASCAGTGNLGAQEPGAQIIQGAGTATVPPGGSVEFVFPSQALPPGVPRPTQQNPLEAVNQSNQSAVITYQGDLTIELPSGFAVELLPPYRGCHYGPSTASAPGSGPANLVTCPAGLGVLAGTYTFTAASHPSDVNGTTAIQLSPGWNLVSYLIYQLSTSVPPTLHMPLYTSGEAGGNGYEQVTLAPTENLPNPALSEGKGYWYFNDPQASVVFALALVGPQETTMPLPAGQYVLIANPGNTVADVTGADAVWIYDPASGTYEETTTLQPGQGAIAYSSAGGSATIIDE